MTDSSARDVMADAVRRELMGPLPGDPPKGKPLPIDGTTIAFASEEEARGPWHDSSTGQEVLFTTAPVHRYGVGVLYPGGRQPDDPLAGVTGLPSDDVVSDERPAGDIEVGPSTNAEADSYDFDLSDANAFQPSAMGVTFQAIAAADGALDISVIAAAYDPVNISVTGAKRERTWWVRRPFTLSSRLGSQQLLDAEPRLVPLPVDGDSAGKVQLGLQAFIRAVPNSQDPLARLITLVVVNVSTGGGPAACAYQVEFSARPSGGLSIPPYPSPVTADADDEEEASIALLYRKRLTYAVGHGCAANWEEAGGGLARWVKADPMPAFQVPSLTPDIVVTNDDGERRLLQVSMHELAEGSATGVQQVEAVLDAYAAWIEDRSREASGLEPQHAAAAQRNLEDCRDALSRMRTGWRLAQSDSHPTAGLAFRLANRAMLRQQLRSRLPRRDVTLSRDGFFGVEGSAPELTEAPDSAFWRPFQIAFLLAALPDLVDGASSTRELVDLIFFPTGGGKTEAYLGAAAVSIIARRLRASSSTGGADDASRADRNTAGGGTDVLMRYTLRLLTAQQFIRAAALTCVLEDIRTSRDDLGDDPISIGIWLGGETTPNTWDQATKALGRMKRDARAENPFLLLRCPWCGTRLGPIPTGSASPANQIAGYVKVGNRVVMRCVDGSCRFAAPNTLPVHVVDEDIYESRPTLVIGTVDKFAMLAWRPQARALFGVGPTGARECDPPGLVIQDELHLISGPLGSMVGLYEPVIEDLCTEMRDSQLVRPKIIASTATIRRYKKQVRDLYGREEVAVFPPQGLEEGRSFFAEPATLADGSPAPGRLYLGVMSASLGSTQMVQTRVAAATLEGAVALPEDRRDGYWTNLNFLNSLRELGNTVSLLRSDIPDYLTSYWKREGINPGDIRWPRNIMELTSRRRSDEIPKAIQDLETPYGESSVIDVCLASNIIEVGVDIDRLALMTIVGQPKTTAQYIQVSGRVGRRWAVAPGLIITIYGAAKPRDRSHYERFVSYHQRLYAQVEPTSVTPFALPVLQRALHGASVARLRQRSAQDLRAYPFPAAAFDEAVALIRMRAEQVNRGEAAFDEEMAAFDSVASRRRREWAEWERTQWDASALYGDPLQGLMRFPGTSSVAGARVPVWDVPSSMRSVDAECVVRVSTAYAQEAAEAAGTEPS